MRKNAFAKGIGFQKSAQEFDCLERIRVADCFSELGIMISIGLPTSAGSRQFFNTGDGLCVSRSVLILGGGRYSIIGPFGARPIRAGAEKAQA